MWWENHFRLELPEFHGRLNPEEFVDWLSTVERVFEYYGVPEDRQVKLVGIKLKGQASAWWEQIQVHQLRRGKPKVHAWIKMKKKLSNHFLPYSYTQQLYQSLHNLKKNRVCGRVWRLVLSINSDDRPDRDGGTIGSTIPQWAEIGYLGSAHVSYVLDLVSSL
jgi:hypothetical protein